jgi:hypothetical protein
MSRPAILPEGIEAILKRLAEHLQTHIDIDGLLTVTRNHVPGAST